ncbi:MAG: hypothetical protein WCI91_03160 [Candidatus Nomurabacteria bacterium]
MARIKIVEVPPGFAPKHIREQWVGVEIPLVENPTPEGKESFQIGNQNSGGYQVDGVEAVRSLIADGKLEAANFWLPYATGNFKFKKEVCELIS